MNLPDSIVLAGKLSNVYKRARYTISSSHCTSNTIAFELIFHYMKISKVINDFRKLLGVFPKTFIGVDNSSNIKFHIDIRHIHFFRKILKTWDKSKYFEDLWLLLEVVAGTSQLFSKHQLILWKVLFLKTFEASLKDLHEPARSDKNSANKATCKTYNKTDFET